MGLSELGVYRQIRPSELKPRGVRCPHWEGDRSGGQVWGPQREQLVMMRAPRPQEGVSRQTSSRTSLHAEAGVRSQMGREAEAVDRVPGAGGGTPGWAPSGQTGSQLGMGGLGTVGLAGSAPASLPAPSPPPEAGLLTRHIPCPGHSATSLQQELGCEVADGGVTPHVQRSCAQTSALQKHQWGSSPECWGWEVAPGGPRTVRAPWPGPRQVRC